MVIRNHQEILLFQLVRLFLLYVFYQSSYCSTTFHSSELHKTFCNNFTEITVKINETGEILQLHFHDSLDDIMSENFIIDLQSDNLEKKVMSSDYCFFQGYIDLSDDMVIGQVVNYHFGATFTHKEQWYEVKPQKILNNKFVVATRKQVVQNATFVCGVTSEENFHSTMISEEETKREETKHRDKRDLKIYSNSNADTKYVELALVADTAYTKSFNSTEQAVFRLIEMINIVNGLYTPLNTKIILSQIILWTTEDKFTVRINRKLSLVLDDFNVYRMNNLCSGYDVAHFITHVPHKNVDFAGVAYHAGSCIYERASAVIVDYKKNVIDAATNIAHELGHNLGLRHDDQMGCTNDSIMANASYITDIWKTWSICSIAEFDKMKVSNGPGYCLRNHPAIKKLPFVTGVNQCGNGIVDAGEQCDCGIPHFCSTNCCDPRTCKFKPGAVCASGSCCDQSNCSIMSKGNECRAKKTECDVTEFCDGDSEWCPDDDYKIDGTRCANGMSYCYNGLCETRKQRCRAIYKNLKLDPVPSYCTQFALRGNTNGYCNRFFMCANSTFDMSVKNYVYDVTYKYEACTEENKRCGTLFCNPANQYSNWQGIEKIQSGGYYKGQGKNQINCNVLDSYFDTQFTGMRDPGMVPNGAECGENKMCVDSKCRSVTDFTSKCPTCTGKNSVCTKFLKCVNTNSG